MDRQEWLEQRRQGIGGSDWMNALGMEPRGCQRQLVYDKRGVERDFDEGEPEGYLTRGQKLEPLIVEEVEERLGIKLHRQSRLAHPPWLPKWWIGNIDRMVAGGGVFEAKTKNPWKFKELKQQGIPPWEIAQTQHYMALAGRETCLYACLEPVSWDLYLTEIKYDADLVNSMLIAGERVWKAVTEGPLPERLDASSKACRACPWRWTCHGEALFKVRKDEGPVERQTISDPGVVELVREAFTLRELVAEAEERLEVITNKVKEFFGGPKKCLIDGHAVSWIEYTEQRFQTTEFKKAHPDLAAQFTKPQTKKVFRWD